MDSNAFGVNHLPSQALVVLSEAAGLNEVLRSQRPFQPRLPDPKDLHNMSLVSGYGTHLFPTFHPHLLQSLNHGMLSNNYFSNDRNIGKPVLGNFQLPSAFSPPKYIGISLEQNILNSSNESFRTDSASPTCTSHESIEGSNDYDGEKGESPRSNNSDPRDLRHIHSKSNPNNSSRSHVPDICPVCGVKLSAEEWNSHFLTELDRLYKLSSGMERTQLHHQNYMFSGTSCPVQENAIRTSHNRWETFQRIRNNRQNRLRIKIRKRKYGTDLYFLENLFCNSCPICKRKYAVETGGLEGITNSSIKMNIDDEQGNKDSEIETVDVESCNDDVPDSQNQPNSQTPVPSDSKLDGALYRSACLINKENSDDDVISNSNNWDSNPQISVKNVNELSSTTHNFYNADSCESRNCGSSSKDIIDTNNDSDEDVIVDDDDTNIKLNIKKRKYGEETLTNRSLSRTPNDDERPRSEPQVTSSEQSESSPTGKYQNFEELRTLKVQEFEINHNHQNNQKSHGSQDNVSSGSKQDLNEYKCFVCKVNKFS
ncbi:hypothetical protein ACFFRR_009727 [Megaselia abdita]